MEFQIDAPDEIKPKIMQRVSQNGALKTIKRKVKIGMMIAIDEIRNSNESQSILERKIFKNADPYELKALQSIFNFLSTNKMNYTLSALLEESAVRRNNADTMDVMDIIDCQINRPEIPTSHYYIDEDPRYYEENPKLASKNKSQCDSKSIQDNYSIEKSKNDFKINNNNILKSSISNCGNNLNYKFNNFIYSSSTDLNSILNDNQINDSTNKMIGIKNSHHILASISNYESNINDNQLNSTNESNPKPNQELQGFSISRRTFERNQFVISVVNL